MMEAAGTSEILAYFYQTTWCNMPEDSHLHIHGHEMKSHQILYQLKVLSFVIHSLRTVVIL
jgi:hypothetical protein